MTWPRCLSGGDSLAVSDLDRQIASAHRTASLKIAIAGKGGVGKTTLAAGLARSLAGRELKVLAIDADPDANLASGLPLDAPEAPSPLAARRDLLKAAASQNGGLPAGMFLINPVLDDVSIPSVSWGGGHRLVVLGWTARGGQGCYCDETAVLKAVLGRLIAAPGEAIVVDGEPGLEHLSRGTLGSVDALLVALDPGARSVQTAETIRSARPRSRHSLLSARSFRRPQPRGSGQDPSTARRLAAVRDAALRSSHRQSRPRWPSACFRACLRRRNRTHRGRADRPRTPQPRSRPL